MILIPKAITFLTTLSKERTDKSYLKRKDNIQLNYLQWNIDIEPNCKIMVCSMTPLFYKIDTLTTNYNEI